MLKMDKPTAEIKRRNKSLTNKQLKQWESLFDLLLCWRKWMQEDKLQKEIIKDSKFAHRALANMILKYAERQKGCQWRIIKFHMIQHITENMLDFGVPINYDTSAPESNHKINVKKPSSHTQMRAACLEIQTANRYFEQLVIDHASNELFCECLKTDQILEDPTIISTGGSTFTITLNENISGDVNNINFEWGTRNKVSKYYGMQYINWIGKHLLSQMGEGSSIRGFTECIVKTYVFRGHPDYRQNGCWHDWALIQWKNDENSYQDVPAQIIMFLQLPGFEQPMEIDGRMTVQKEGLYALVESFYSKIDDISMKSLIACKKNKSIERNPKQNTSKISDKCIYLVEVESINGPITCISNIGSSSFEFIVVRPVEEWYKGFNMFIEKSKETERKKRKKNDHLISPSLLFVS